jgi:hypothetical protein
VTIGVALPAMLVLNGCFDQDASPAASVAKSEADARRVDQTPDATSAPPTSGASETSNPATSSPAPPSSAETTGAPEAPPATTAPPGDVQFSEDFVDPGSFYTRFDHGFSGEVLAGSAFGDAANDWHGDHDGSCGNPNQTDRTIHIDPDNPKPGVESQFYGCVPGGDPAKAHVMTTVNTEGYNIAWFSPKPTFDDVRQVCWDQNLTFLGNGKWTQVVFLTEDEVKRSEGDLGFTSPEFPNDGGPSTPRGSAANGIKIGVLDQSNGDPPSVIVRTWRDGDFTTGDEGLVAGPGTDDKAPRYQLCAIDGVGVTVALPSGKTVTVPVSVEIPAGPIRVVFQDDNYNPDKHFANDHSVERDTSDRYTWHWDNIQVT